MVIHSTTTETTTLVSESAQDCTNKVITRIPLQIIAYFNFEICGSWAL